MINDDVLHLLLPGMVHAGYIEFRDFVQKCDVRVTDRFTLEMEAEFPNALIRFDVELKPHAMDYSTLYEELSVYPTGDFMPLGPLDLSFAGPRMVMPMLAVSLDGELYGKMWFEMPSVEDVKAEKLGGVFALEFPGGGRHRVTIRVDEADRERLDLFMVERITVRYDDRKYVQLMPEPDWNPRKPWLLLEGHSIEDLRALRAGSHKEVWTSMERTVDDWLETGTFPGRGFPVVATLGFLSLVEEDGRYQKHLVDLLEKRYVESRFLVHPNRTFQFFDDTEDLFSEDVRWVMGYGWNDYGFSWILQDYACIYQWLGNNLPEHLKSWLEDNLIRYGRALYRFILFQRQYGGGLGFWESHSIVPDMTVMTLGAALYDVLPEAQQWLAFGTGRVYEALDLTPADGRMQYQAWGPPWLAQAVELMSAFAGKDERNRPFFRNLATALWRQHVGEETEQYYGYLLTAYTATHVDDPAGQWYYQYCRSKTAKAGQHRPSSYVSFLWHCAKPGRDPGDIKDTGCYFSDTAAVLVQTKYEQPQFAARIQCGPCLGHSAALHLESFQSGGMTWPFPYGGFNVSVNGKMLISEMPGYVNSLRNGSFVCVDGEGFYFDGMYLIGRTEKIHQAFIRKCEIGDDICYVDGITTPAYKPGLQITMCRRQWLFDPAQEWMLLLDDIESPIPHDYHLHLHGPSVQIQDPGRFVFKDGEAELHVVSLAEQPTEYTLEVPSTILTYGYQYTSLKSGRLLGTDGGTTPSIPKIQHLVCRATGQRHSAQFTTIMSPHRIEWQQKGDQLEIYTPLGSRKVMHAEAGLTWS